MIQPVELDNFFLAFFSGALVVIAGALYALLFALSRLYRRSALLMFAYAAYMVLFISVFVLARVMNLSGFWLVLVGTMVVGYLLAPHAIWHLCVGTHPAEADEIASGVTPASSDATRQ
jgi:hypothetical protein